MGRACPLRDLGAPFDLKDVPGAVFGFALSPDGKTLLLRTNEGIVLRFSVDPPR